MRATIDDITITPKRINTFTTDVQNAYAAVCQHVEWLFQSTGCDFQHIPHVGSSSWLPCGGDTSKVMVKVLPWDGRMSQVTGPYSQANGGVIVLVRDEYLSKEDMRALWEEYSTAYHPCPPAPLYYVPIHNKKAFQLLIWGLDGSCDLNALSGVDPSRFERMLSSHPHADDEGNADVVYGKDLSADRPAEAHPLISEEMPRIVKTLRGLLQRANDSTK